MSMTNCNECGYPISGSARTCPRCGHKRTTAASAITAIIVALVTSGIIIWVATAITNYRAYRLLR